MVRIRECGEVKGSQELRRQLCAQLRRSRAQLEKLSSLQFPRLSPTPETAAATDRTHVLDTIDATAGGLAQCA